MPTDAITIATLQNFSEGGQIAAPTDNRGGLLYRPVAVGEDGGRIAAMDQYFAYWLDDVEDPDEALARDPAFLDKISMHPDVQAAMRKRELAVASLPDRIEANPKAPEEQKYIAEFVAEYVRDVWEDIPDRHKLYEWMQQAVLLGGVGVEWVWHKGPKGEYPVAWYPIHKSRFVFDRQGNMALKTRNLPVWGEYVKANEVSQYLWRDGRQPPFGKFMYHTYRKEPGTWENPQLEGYIYFGKGEVVPLFYVVLFDIQVLRSRLKWIDKYSEPPTLLSYPDNDPLSGYTAAIATSLRNEAVISRPRIMGQEPNGIFDIEQMEVPSPSFDAMGDFQKTWTKPKIDTLLLGDAGAQDKASDDGKGGYADSVSRHDQGPQKYYVWDAKNISATINSQLIPAIVWKRFPNLPRNLMPIHQLEPKEEKDRDQELQIIERVSKLGVPVPVRSIYEASGIQKPEPDLKTGQMEPTIGGSPAAPQGVQPAPVASADGMGGELKQPLGEGMAGGDGVAA